MRSLLATSASTRPLYWAFEEVVVLEVIKFAMSATPSRPPPTPGVVGLTQPRSCVPKAVFKGEPISRPWPGIVLQFTPSSRRGGSERRGFIPSVADAAGVGFASSLIVKEEEDLILPDRAANVAAELIKPVVVSQNAIA